MPNGNLYQNVGGGVVFVAGPYPNYFGKTYGGIGPGQLSVEPAATKEGALNMRNTYQAAHPDWETKYKDSNSAGVFVTWRAPVDGVDTVFLLGQQLILDASIGKFVWMDAASAVGVQGPAGIQLVNFNEISDNQIPVLFHIPGDNEGRQVAKDSGFSLQGTSLVSMHEIAINNTDGLTMGLTRVAPFGNDVILANDFFGGASTVVRSAFAGAEGSKPPGYTKFAPWQVWAADNDELAVGAGNPLRFVLWHPVDATLAELGVRIASSPSSVEVPGCAFRVRLDSFDGRLIYDSYLASGGLLFGIEANTSGSPNSFDIPMFGGISVPAWTALYCEIFSASHSSLAIQLAGQVMLTPLGNQFVPAVRAAGFPSSWQEIGGGAGGVQSVSGNTIDNTDPANPVVVAPRYSDGKGILFEHNGTGDCRVSNTGVVSLVAGQGMLVEPNPADATEVMIASTGVVEVVADGGIVVDNSDPARPMVKNTGVLTLTAATGIFIQEGPEGPGHLQVRNEGVLEVQAGSNVVVDNTDPKRPIVSATGGPGGGVQSVSGQAVNNTDPANPIITSPVFHSGYGIRFNTDNPAFTRVDNTGVNKLTAGEGISVTWENTVDATVVNEGVLGLVAGSNITIDATNPKRPVINSAGGSGGFVPLVVVANTSLLPPAITIPTGAATVIPWASNPDLIAAGFAINANGDIYNNSGAAVSCVLSACVETKAGSHDLAGALGIMIQVATAKPNQPAGAIEKPVDNFFGQRLTASGPCLIPQGGVIQLFVRNYSATFTESIENSNGSLWLQIMRLS